MDVRKIFREVSTQLASEFRKTSAVSHSGGKGTLREDAFAGFLSDHMPKRYSIGRGEVISSMNQVSAQMDVVLYDAERCPMLLVSDAHAVYPVESIYGVVSIKSTLKSDELREAYSNVASAKRLVAPENFALHPSPGFSVSVGPPRIVGVVFAYQADRSLDAIAAQAEELDRELDGDIHLRPDFIVVLEQGIVGPLAKLRGSHNHFGLPRKPQDMVRIRKTGRHTLLRTYL